MNKEDGKLLRFGFRRSLVMETDYFVSSILGPSLLMKVNTIKKVSCGFDFSLVQTVSGEVFCFKGKQEQGSVVNQSLVMKDTSIKFIQQRNFIDEWKPENHQTIPNNSERLF